MKLFKFIASLAFLMPLVGLANDEITLMHGPGGANDNVARLIQKYEPLKNYIVVNRPGAGGRIAIQHMKNNKSIVFVTAPQIFVNNVLIDPNLSYNPESIKSIAVLGYMPSVLLCHKNSGINDITDLQRSSKSLSFGVGGVGSNEHISTSVLLNELGNVNHVIVPFPVAGNTTFTSLLGGHVDCMFANYPTVKRLLPSENINIIMSSENLNLNVKTWKAIFNKEFPIKAYLVMVVDEGTPEDKVNQYVSDFNRLFAIKEIPTILRDIGLVPELGTTEESFKKVQQANQRIKKIVVDNKIDLGK